MQYCVRKLQEIFFLKQRKRGDQKQENEADLFMWINFSRIIVNNNKKVIRFDANGKI